MSIQLQHAITGGKELEKALRELGEAAGQKGGPVKLALKHAAIPVLDTMQMKVAKHTKTGTLLESLKIMRHPNPKYLNEIFGVGVHNMGQRPRKGENQDTGKPWYAWIVEYGGRGSSGPLKGFARGSLEENRQESTTIYTVDLAKGINKLARKIGNKNAQVVLAKAEKARAKWTSRISSGPVEKPFSFRGPLKS